MKKLNPCSANRVQRNPDPPCCTAFEGQHCIASGPLGEVVGRIKAVTDGAEREPILVFDDRTGRLVEVDFRGTVDEVIERLSRTKETGAEEGEVQGKRGLGRPRLGVIAREVTLLPGQWDWLDGQPSGASAALRRLVHEAKRSSQGQDRARQSQEAAYRFMTAMAGNLPGFEEALRAFYRRDHERFGRIVEPWPEDVRDHVKKLVAIANRDQTAAQPKDNETLA